MFAVPNSVDFFFSIFVLSSIFTGDVVTKLICLANILESKTFESKTLSHGTIKNKNVNIIHQQD